MKFKKLRRIYRILFPIKLSEKDIFEKKLLSNPLVKRFEMKEDNNYVLTFRNGIEVRLRDGNHSDYEVFNQIFNQEEYKVVVSILMNNGYLDEEIVLIDAGANVGYTTVYFMNRFKNIRVFCVEPSPANVEKLKRNIFLIDDSCKTTVYENALSGREKMSFILDYNFRDGRDWSCATIEQNGGEIDGITVNEIIEKNRLDYISILKIDIEGAERFIFCEDNDLSFLEKTKVLAIEIHDEFDCRGKIYEILKSRNFMLFESGELTVGVNSSQLNFFKQ